MCVPVLLMNKPWKSYLNICIYECINMYQIYIIFLYILKLLTSIIFVFFYVCFIAFCRWISLKDPKTSFSPLETTQLAPSTACQLLGFLVWATSWCPCNRIYYLPWFDNWTQASGSCPQLWRLVGRLVGWLVEFYGVPTILGYFMPNPFLYI